MLQTYVEDGRAEIDNNLVENAIRPTAVGKKSWLFIGSLKRKLRVTLGLNVSRLRHARELTQEKLAELVEIVTALHERLASFMTLWSINPSYVFSLGTPRRPDTTRRIFFVA